MKAELAGAMFVVVAVGGCARDSPAQPVPTQEVVAAPTAEASDTSPAWSAQVDLPEGVTVAFTDENGLWVWDSPSEPRHLVEAPVVTPLIAPDRSSVFYRRFDKEAAYAYWLAPTDGS